MTYDQIATRLADIGNLSEFAGKAGIPRRTLQRLKTGEGNPTKKMLDNIEAALKLHRPARKPKAEAA